MKITPALFEAFLKCPTKCWLRFTGEPTAGNAYADWVQTQNESYRSDAMSRLRADTPAEERTVDPPADTVKTAQWHLALDVTVASHLCSSRGHEARTSSPSPSTENSQPTRQSQFTPAATVIESRLHAVERIPSEGRGKPAQFIPTRFIYRNKLTNDDKLLLAFDAFVLSEFLGREVSLGNIIHGDNNGTLNVKLGARTAESARTSATSKGLINEVRKRIEKVIALLSGPTTIKSADSPGREPASGGDETRGLGGPRSGAAPPDLVLIRHCAECEFQARCRKIAVEKDDLSLLARMSAHERKKNHSKGIFTVTQLSYTFRARRRCKRWKSQHPGYSHALKALAIREKTVHVIGQAMVEWAGTPVYLDVEGTDDDFFYLIGVRTGSSGAIQQHSFWADTESEERVAFEKFLEFLALIPNPVLIFYGSYERRFLSAMRQRYPDLFERFSRLEPIFLKAVNLIPVVYGKIYFPTFSNTLKDLAKHIGFGWTSPEASGLQSLVWRAKWESTRDDRLKSRLLQYNAEDCEALELVVGFVNQLYQKAPLSARATDCVRVEEMKTTGPFLINKGLGALPEFKAINQAAYWDYQRQRVYVRTSKVIKKVSRSRKARVKPHRARGIVSHPAPERCPSCGDLNLVARCHRLHRVVYDIKFLSHGVKAFVTTHSSQPLYCTRCQRSIGSPLDHPFSICKYGPTLRAYAIDQLVRLNIPGATIAKSLGALFKYELKGEHISGFKADFAEIYPDIVKDLTAKITKGPLVHADETAARVVGKSAVVWVLSSMEEVVFLYADNREGEMIKELLSEFRGVLVSDFYAVYDAFTCPQQKCLIHLMRDLNDDLHRYPFDSELRQIASEFTAVLKPIVETIDQRGLKSHFLAKHKPSVQRLLTWVTSQEFESETAKKYGQRFRKNREKLFAFMGYDGVPWNNNNAENAIRAFAVIRQRVGGLCTEKSLRHYLVLLSISETCKRRGLNFFDFLRSGETSFEGFAAKQTSRPKSKPRERARPDESGDEREDTHDDEATQRSAQIALRNQAMQLIADLPSPWDRFRSPVPIETTPISKGSLKLERFDAVPFGGVVLAIPALMEAGLWEQASGLFPERIDRQFAEIALTLIASLVLCPPADGETMKRAWPAGWDEVLYGSRLPSSRSVVDLIQLIGRSQIEVAMWQGALSAKWINDASRVRAVLLIDGQQRVLLEAAALSCVDDRARNSLLAHGFVELWHRILDGAPMLLLTQTPIENIKSIWKECILPQIQDVLSGHLKKPGSSIVRESLRLTVVFGKGGADLGLFRKLQRDGMHIFSYRLSGDELWPDEEFTEHGVEVKPGYTESLRTAELALSTAANLPLREIRCVFRNGLRLAIISSDRELDLYRIAARLALEFTASGFLRRLQKNLALVRSYYPREGADRTPEPKSRRGLEGFLGAMVLIVSRSLSDLARFRTKSLILDHQNTFTENQNASYRIVERRI